MAELTTAWKICTSVLTDSSISHSTYTECLTSLQRAGCARAYSVWVLKKLEQTIRLKVAEPLSTGSRDDQSEDGILHVISDAHHHFIQARTFVAGLERIPECQGCMKRFHLRSAAILDQRLPGHFSTVVYDILRNRLRGCNNDNLPLKSVKVLCSQLVELGFSRIMEEAVTWVMFETMDDLVSETAATSLHRRALPGLITWMEEFLDGWVASVLPPPEKAFDLSRQAKDEGRGMIVESSARFLQMEQWRKRLSFHLHESVCGIRTEQFLKLIESYPKSSPALEDLKDCIASTDQKPFVTVSLRDTFQSRILNAGTLTTEILQQYVNMIRALRFLDPTGVILEHVSGPVREYLRHRPDTVRCIVSGMTGDGDLYEELQRGHGMRRKDGDGDVNMNGEAVSSDKKVRDQEDEDCLSIDGDFNSNMVVDAEEYNRWEPEPNDAPRKDGKWRSGGDAIATLVTIYGSSEQIVNDYKTLLADKLVSNFDLDLERESKILQLLTERFGKDAMHDCSIMLKDVRDSRATLDVARGREKKNSDILSSFEATVISKEFWPKLVEEPEYEGTEDMQQQISVFDKAFTKLKEPRKLRWQHGLGVVSLTLSFEDGRSVQTNVTPVQATILSHFARKRKQNLKDLRKLIGVESETVLRRKLQVLVSQGILRSTDSSNMTYETVEHAEEVESESALAEEESGDGEDADGEDQGTKDGDIAVYEKYVMAMLQNLKQLPLEQIHNMLQRFMQTPAYDKTQAQLATLLGKLAETGKIELVAGMYRVKK